MHLQKVFSLEEALEIYLSAFPPLQREEVVPLSEAMGRLLARTISSSEALPAFSRSMMDGYAVRSLDLGGASEAVPALLEVVGEVEVGQMPTCCISPGQAAAIATGAALPEGADAVIMVEHTERFAQTTVAMYRPVARGENVFKPGEDLSPGEVVFTAGHRLRHGDLGVLAALGITQIAVRALPKVAIFSTGNELVNAELTPAPGQVRDINAYTLAGQVKRNHGRPFMYGILPDRENVLFQELSEARAQHDLVLLSGGSSVGVHDLTAQVLMRLGNPGVLVHGLALKPGKPTILAVADGVPIIGFPGHPLSALITSELLIPRVIAKLSGFPVREHMAVQAHLGRSLHSQVGRAEYIPVRLIQRENVLVAEPLLSRSAAIASVARSDGYIRIPAGSEGLPQGVRVEVFVWEE